MNTFPLEIFPAEFQVKFRQISESKSIPLQYIGASALWSISALAGNMYKLQTDEGNIKPILFLSLVGPSSVGKSPAYRHTCGKYIKDIRKQFHDDWRDQHDKWKVRKKDDGDLPEPREIIRIIEEGTSEAIEHTLVYNPAGIGLIYDEGERLFSGANAYKRDSSTVAFFNTLYNGDTYQAIRVNADANRFIINPCVNVLMGLQKDRVVNYFKEDVIKSGLFGRFLFVASEYIPINTISNVMSREGFANDDWTALIRSLFNRGARFKPEDTRSAPIHPTAIGDYDAMRSLFKLKANEDIKTHIKDDVSEIMLAYNAKLYVYFQKFCLILAIMRDPVNPVIEKADIYNAERLHTYFLKEAKDIITPIHKQNESGLSPNESLLLDNLPDLFSKDQANAKAAALGLSETFFKVAYCRKYKNGFIRKREGTNYEKLA